MIKRIDSSVDGRRFGDRNPAWKGEAAKYGAKHRWVSKRFGRPFLCEECGTTEIPKDKKQWFEWANVSGEYKRERSDWKRLCVPCHRNMDIATHPMGEKHYHSKLTEKQVRVIKWALHYGADDNYLAQAFKVTNGAIRGIKYGKSWKHILIN